MDNKKELIRRLEIRKEQLINPNKSAYPIGSQHHFRDIFTILAYLKDDPLTDKLIINLPDNESLKAG